MVYSVVIIVSRKKKWNSEKALLTVDANYFIAYIIIIMLSCRGPGELVVTQHAKNTFFKNTWIWTARVVGHYYFAQNTACTLHTIITQQVQQYLLSSQQYQKCKGRRLPKILHSPYVSVWKIIFVLILQAENLFKTYLLILGVILRLQYRNVHTFKRSTLKEKKTINVLGVSSIQVVFFQV